MVKAQGKSDYGFLYAWARTGIITSPLSRPVAVPVSGWIGFVVGFPLAVRAKGSNHGRGEEGGRVCVEDHVHRSEAEYPGKVSVGTRWSRWYSSFRGRGEGGGEVTFRVS